MPKRDLLDDLSDRGLIADTTDRERLRERLAAGPITLYCGLDPTADSLHVGNLQALLLLRRFQDAGHRPIALVGGGTGSIGDPSGRDAERPLLDDATLDHNVACLKEQYARVVDFDAGAELVDNREWLGTIGLIEFLREVGKHVTISVMSARDSVRTRLDRDQGLSYTEFSYQLLQAYDYRVLFDRHSCELQVAGSDQWGNIIAGVDLIRRTRGVAVHALTAPLLTDSDGRKYGKSTGGGRLWLDRDRTSPYQLYQFFMQAPDDMVETLLMRLTLLSVEECRAIASEHAADPGRRGGQRRLAEEVVEIVHSDADVRAATDASAVLFGGDPTAASPDAFAVLEAELEVTEIPAAEFATLDAGELFVRSGLAKSKGEIRREPKGFYLDGISLETSANLDNRPAIHNCFHLLRRGKARYHLVKLV